MDEAQERENAPGNKIILRNISRHIHTRHRYPGGPTRVPKNGNAVRYPGGPHGPPGYAMATWRLCARATRVNRHFVLYIAAYLWNIAIQCSNCYAVGCSAYKLIYIVLVLTAREKNNCETGLLDCLRYPLKGRHGLNVECCTCLSTQKKADSI